MVEGDQTFQLAIVGSDPTLTLNVPSSTTTVTITDNDGEQIACMQLVLLLLLSGWLHVILQYCATDLYTKW